MKHEVARWPAAAVLCLLVLLLNPQIVSAGRQNSEYLKDGATVKESVSSYWPEYFRYNVRNSDFIVVSFFNISGNCTATIAKNNAFFTSDIVMSIVAGVNPVYFNTSAYGIEAGDRLYVRLTSTARVSTVLLTMTNARLRNNGFITTTNATGNVTDGSPSWVVYPLAYNTPFNITFEALSGTPSLWISPRPGPGSRQFVWRLDYNGTAIRTAGFPAGIARYYPVLYFGVYSTSNATYRLSFTASTAGGALPPPPPTNSDELFENRPVRSSVLANQYRQYTYTLGSGASTIFRLNCPPRSWNTASCRMYVSYSAPPNATFFDLSLNQTTNRGPSFIVVRADDVPENTTTIYVSVFGVFDASFTLIASTVRSPILRGLLGDDRDSFSLPPGLRKFYCLPVTDGQDFRVSLTTQNGSATVYLSTNDPEPSSLSFSWRFKASGNGNSQSIVISASMLNNAPQPDSSYKKRLERSLAGPNGVDLAEELSAQDVLSGTAVALRRDSPPVIYVAVEGDDPNIDSSASIEVTSLYAPPPNTGGAPHVAMASSGVFSLLLLLASAFF